jgi:hypothetical protein
VKEDKFKRHIYVLEVHGLKNCKMGIKISLVPTGGIRW